MIPREVMTMLARRRLVAEIRTDTAVQALSVVDALAAGGITSMEISLTIPGAHEILTHLAMRQDVLVGAGAVLDARQAKEAISCGARFIASPIMNAELVPTCRDANVACVLGALTPTEIIAAQRAGAEMVKLFPVEALGGPLYVRALFRQLTHLSLQVSGGFTPENLGEYLALPVRTLSLGSLLIPRPLVDRGNWQALTARARAFVEYVVNPHAYAAQFLAMMGATQQPQYAQPQYAQPQYAQPQYAYPAATPGPVPAVAVSAIPTMPTPEGAGEAAEAALARIEAEERELASEQPPEWGHSSANVPAASVSASGFRPWDSRPVTMGDEEDWLR